MRIPTAFVLVLVASRAVSAQDVAVRLDSAMRVAEREGFSGVVRIERAGTTLLDKGYGLANRATRTPFTAATVVQIGSNTKDFTAVAILQLLEAGKLKLTDSLVKYFPAAPSDKRAITISQLLDHTAGFRQDMGGDFAPFSRSMLIDSALKSRLLSEPGQRESYSNTGFSLLAAIIEQVSGTTYDIYVRDHILAPLGLHKTGFLLPGFSMAELAHGYAGNGNDEGVMLAKPHAADGPYWNLRGNGGMLSTAGEMHAFYAALFESEKLMSARTRALRFHVNEPIGLAGSDGVNVFYFGRFPGARTEVIVASTNAAVKAPRIRQALEKILGLQGDDEPDGPRQGGVAAPAAIALVLEQFVRAVNSGNAADLRTFITDHFATDPDSPPLEDRVTRFSGMHGNLGTLTVVKAEVFPEGPAELTLKSATKGAVVVKAVIDRAAPHRIHAMQVLLGG